jgi:predicted Zn-dependent protease
MTIEPVQIVQMLLLFEKQSSEEYGLALWAALHEVETFYNLHEKRVIIQRFYISPYVPSTRFFASFFTTTQVTNALDLLRQDERVQTSLAGDEAIKRNTKTYDQKKLLEVTREKLLRERFGAAASVMPLMIITDRPITPPENWRYTIWESWLEPQPSAVISTMALDPAYWQISDEGRIATIKHRARAAIMSVCGRFLGLHPCGNPRCFLYSPVDSVTNLDLMVRLGDEHSSEIAGLSGRGFEPIPRDPNIIQRIVPLPSGASGGLK